MTIEVCVTLDPGADGAEVIAHLRQAGLVDDLEGGPGTEWPYYVGGQFPDEEDWHRLSEIAGVVHVGTESTSAPIVTRIIVMLVDDADLPTVMEAMHAAGYRYNRFKHRGNYFVGRSAPGVLHADLLPTLRAIPHVKHVSYDHWVVHS